MKPIIILFILIIHFLTHQIAYADSPPEGSYPFRLSRVKTGVPYSFPIGNDSTHAFLILVFDSDKAIDSAYVVIPNGQKISIPDTFGSPAERVYYIEIQEADYHIEITGTIRRPGSLLEIKTRSETTRNSIQYWYAGGQLRWIQVLNHEETSAIKWKFDYLLGQYYIEAVFYESDAQDLDKKIFTKPLYTDSILSYRFGGRLGARHVRFGEVDSIYIYSVCGRLQSVLWQDKTRKFIYTRYSSPGFISYKSSKDYNRKGMVVRLHYFDHDQDAFTVIHFNKNGDPKRICKGFRKTEECRWYRRDGSVRRTKSWERERYIHPVDWDFDIETLY